MEIAGRRLSGARRAVRGRLLPAVADANHRIRVHVATDEETAGAVGDRASGRSRAGSSARCTTCTACCSSGNADLRRILTDYGFRGHPQRKDFPLTGLRRAALFGRGQARRVRAGAAGAGFPHVRLHEPVGGRRIRPAGRREGARCREAKGAPTPLTADADRQGRCRASADADAASAERAVRQDDARRTARDRRGQAAAGRPAPKPADARRRTRREGKGQNQ